MLAVPTTEVNLYYQPLVTIKGEGEVFFKRGAEPLLNTPIKQGIGGEASIGWVGREGRRRLKTGVGVYSPPQKKGRL
jgi:hypothetical protein